jgi:hypothetical protein
MDAADKEDSTNWTPLPRAASTDEGRRQLVDDLVNDRYPVRYVDEMCAISQSPGDAGRLEILEWRVGRLPEHFVRLGEFDWKWGFLTHAGRTLQRIEIQFPKDETAAESVALKQVRQTLIRLISDRARIKESPAAYRGPGRESLKDKIQTAARNIPAEKRPKTKTAWAKMVADQLKVGFSTAKEWVYPLWDDK